MFTRGNSEEARAALARSLEIAEAVGDTAYALQLIGRLHLFHHREGDFSIALQYARRAPPLPRISKMPPARRWLIAFWEFH